MKSFTEYLTEKEHPCPPATQDVKLNTKNRDATTKQFAYGPLNVDEPGDYWEKIAKKWDTSVEAAKKSVCANCVAFDISARMKDCMPGETSDDDGELGYCWMHHFKCHSARTCTTWAKGGPITDDKVSYDWQDRSMTKKEESELAESNPKKAVQNKAKETGIAFDILWDVYKRGVGAWRTGHRPGTTPEQWGLARVNSFVTGGKTQKTTDADLWKKHKGG